jgi:hypothetical protein
MFGLSLTVRNARLQQIVDALDAGSGHGKITLYTGTQPAIGATTSLTQQCAIELAKPCGVVDDAILTFTPDVEGQRTAEDTITWARFTDSDNTFVMDASVSVVDGDGEIWINNVNGYVGAFVQLVSGVMGE